MTAQRSLEWGGTTPLSPSPACDDRTAVFGLHQADFSLTFISVTQALQNACQGLIERPCYA